MCKKLMRNNSILMLKTGGSPLIGWEFVQTKKDF